ncbi:MAG: NnrS family protein [Cohaesibacter sp.]|jgi:uncharacterized protein involved in response to NO|nr:NnrS family protein [Cohaesibacter sp.]
MTDLSSPAKPRFSASAFFSIGFRPFYFAGALYAAISLGIWLAYLFDAIELNGPFDGLMWHSHELIFGFAAAILVGFLFTAVRNWTGLPTPSGPSLAALLAVWAAGRIGMLTGPSMLAMIIDLAFLPLAALSIAIPLVKSGNRRNYFTFILMLILAAANAGFYATSLGLIPLGASDLFLFAVDIFALFITVIGGRIIPLFSNNATGSKRAQRVLPLEHALTAGMLLILISDLVFGISEEWAGARSALLLFVALMHCVKIGLWRPQITLKDPILWILPLSYMWVPIALLLRAWALMDGPVDMVLSLHALTAGAMGGMMLAMMTRSALGHTGRKITASWAETCIYCLVMLSAIIRVFGPIIVPQYYLIDLALSGLFWILAFGLFALRYWSILTRPRQ